MAFSTNDLFGFSDTVAERQSEKDDTEVHQLSLYYNKKETKELKRIAKKLMLQYCPNKADANISDFIYLVLQELAKAKNI